jgi:hypothetical protein
VAAHCVNTPRHTYSGFQKDANIPPIAFLTIASALSNRSCKIKSQNQRWSNKLSFQWEVGVKALDIASGTILQGSEIGNQSLDSQLTWDFENIGVCWTCSCRALPLCLILPSLMNSIEKRHSAHFELFPNSIWTYEETVKLTHGTLKDYLWDIVKSGDSIGKTKIVWTKESALEFYWGLILWGKINSATFDRIRSCLEIYATICSHFVVWQYFCNDQSTKDSNPCQ